MSELLKEIREKYPQYNEWDDEKLVTALHQKYNQKTGSDISIDDYKLDIDYQPTYQEPVEQELPEGIDAMTGAAVPVDPYPQAKPWEPSLWDRFKELGSSDAKRALAMTEAFAQREAKKLQIPVEEVYSQAGFTRPALNPEGRPSVQAFVEGAGIVAEQLPEVPGAVVNSVLRVIRGGDETADKNFLDEAIEFTEPSKPENVDPNYKNFYGVGKSLGFSLATLSASATAGVLASETVVGAPAAAFAAGGAVAYRASKDEFLDRVKEKLDAYSEKIVGRPLNQEEWDKAFDEYESAAQKYGAWEAIPEALSNLVFMRALALPFKGMGKEALLEATKRAGQVQLSEQVTETATGVGQSYAEAEAGLGKEKTIGEAFREQMIQTALVTTIMGGGASGAKYGYETAEQKLAPGRVMGREMEQQLAQTEFVDKAGDVAISALSPEMAQIKATPQAEKSVAMLVKEKLFDQGVDLTVPMDTIPTQPIAQLPEPVEEIKQDVTLDKPSTPTERDQRERGDTDQSDRKPAGEPTKELDKPTEQPKPSSKTDKPLADTGIQQPDTLKVKGKEIVETPISEITLSEDVPQFKEGADVKGVVDALGGKFDRVGVAPIQIWIRNDGRKEVITGRHRLDLATRSGEETIPTQYHYESEGFGAEQAAALDAILNIREGQGKVKDYVEFIKATKLTEKEAAAQGILARATGKRAYTIANKGSDALIASHRANVITDEAAVRIANAAPKNESLQAVGIKAIQDGKTISVAENLVKAVSSMTGGQEATGDMFGFDDSAMKEAEAMAKKAVSKQSEIQRTLSAIQGATKRPELARKEGIDVKDPEAIKKRIAQLKDEKKKWDSWHTDPALVAELKGEKFGLTQETEEQRLSREKSEQAAKDKTQAEEKAADDKDQADKDVDDFTLTGSTATTDELEARGQDTLFDEKADYDNLSSTKAEAHKSPKKNADKTVDTLGNLEGSILANQMAKDYKAKGVTSLIGQTVATSLDLAVLGQVYRNPSFETFRFFFVREGIVVGQTGVTSRMPGETKLFSDRDGFDLGVAEMKQRMRRLKADGYYMFHNHPSGTMSPSRADKNATIAMAEKVDGFKGHVIVNEKKYVKIDQDQLWQVHEIEGLTPEYDLSVPAKSGEMLGKRIGGPDDFALVGTEYYRPDWVVVVGRQGATGKVSGIMEVPISAIENRTNVRLAAYIRAFQRKTGSVDVALTNVPRAIHRKVTNAIRNGWLLDAIDVDGKSMGGPIFRESEPKHKAVAAKESEDLYYSSSFTPRESKAVNVSLTKEVKPPKGKEGVTINVKDQTVFGMKIDTNAKKKSKGTVKKDSDVFYAPGHNYVGMYRSMGIPPRKDILTIDGKKIIVPGKVQRIEPIIRTLTKIIGRRIYFGKIKGKTRLGFYRDSTGEIRSKKKNDVEVLAHEMAHYLDMYSNDILPNFAKLYKSEKYSNQVMALSYTDENKSLQQSEGFAEFVRLWLTNANEAQERAPDFYQAFNKTLARDKRLAKPMKKMQEQMHKFYFQGADKLGQALIGDEGNFAGKFNQWIYRRDSRIRQQTIDRFHAARKIEQELTGKISKAGESAWKQLRVSNGGYEGIADYILNYGTVNFDAKGDIVKTGRSLHDVLKPVETIKRIDEHKKDSKMDLLMRYFAGRRALELHIQGRENLLPVESAKAWARLGGTYPVFEGIFKEYQQFNSRMMDFYEEAGLLTHESRATIQNMNKDYVPFNRIRETLETGKTSGGGFHKLKGGTANLNDILVNIQDGVTSNVRHALNNKAKTRLYQYISSHKDGAIFATKIAPDSKPVKVYMEEMIKKIGDVLDASGIDASEIDMDIPGLLTFWQHGVKPTVNESGNIVDTVLIEGKPRYYEVQDPMLQEMLLAMNPESYSSFMNIMFGVKNFFTRTITLGIEFTGANLVRDTIGAAFLSKHGFRPFYDSFKGMYSFLRKDKHFQDFMKSGGGYSSRIEASTSEGKARRRVAVDEFGVMSIPEKLFSVFDHYSSAFEYGTRIGEFRLAKKAGETNMDAAYAAREISTDFSVLGANRFLTGYIRTIPFLNAMVQSQDRVYREALIQRKYDGNPAGMAMKAFMGITLPTLLLYMMNRDDEDYQAIPDYEKRTNWHVKVGKRFIKIPRPYDVGFVYATMPELYFKYVEDDKGKEFADGMMWTLTQMYGVDGTPAALSGWWDLIKNEKWTGAPVVPHALADVEATEQYNANTSETFIRLGQALGMSPIKAEHAFKAYTGYLGGYLLWGTNKILWDKDRFGEEPMGDLSDNIFIRRFITKEVRPSTHAMEKFFDLKEKSDKIVATYRANIDVRRALSGKMDKKGKFKDDKFFGLSGNEKKVLFGLNDSMNKLIGMLYGKEGVKTAEIAIRYDKKLSAEEKRKKLDKLWISRNKAFMTYYNAANKALMKAKKEAEKFNQEKK